MLTEFVRRGEVLSLQPFLPRRNLLHPVDQIQSVWDGTELGLRLLQMPQLLKLHVGRIFWTLGNQYYNIMLWAIQICWGTIIQLDLDLKQKKGKR